MLSRNWAGKMIVEFRSIAISARTCRLRNWSAGMADDHVGALDLLPSVRRRVL
jgi:hypothetical protein